MAVSLLEINADHIVRGNLSMRKIYIAMLGAAFLLGLTHVPARAEAGIGAFFGNWKGSGISESEVSSNFHMTVRDLEVTIKPAADTGFEITWSTVQRQKGNPANPTEAVKAATLTFSAVGGGVWQAKSGDPMSGGQLAWARIEENTLIISTFQVAEDGHGEYQVYRRTLTGSGMELEFVRLEDGRQLRTAKARLTKFSN